MDISTEGKERYYSTARDEEYIHGKTNYNF
jgi:hypothetical protein